MGFGEWRIDVYRVGGGFGDEFFGWVWRLVSVILGWEKLRWWFF